MRDDRQGLLDGRHRQSRSEAAMNRISQFFGIDEDSEQVFRQPQSIGSLREPSHVRFNVVDSRPTETSFGSPRYYVHQG
jgi:hypothetical protein